MSRCIHPILWAYELSFNHRRLFAYPDCMHSTHNRLFICLTIQEHDKMWINSIVPSSSSGDMLCSPCHPFQSQVMSFHSSVMWDVMECGGRQSKFVRKVSQTTERDETGQIEKHNLIIIIHVFCVFYLHEMFLITSSSSLSFVCAKYAAMQECTQQSQNRTIESKENWTLNILTFHSFQWEVKYTVDVLR